MRNKVRELQEELERVKYHEKIYKDEVESLRARVKELESGSKCKGKWCQCCIHAGSEEIRYENGRLIMGAVVCLKEVPCQDFVRRDHE